MTVWYRFFFFFLSGWRITPPYASFYKRNTFNVDLMQIQQLLCLQKSTLNVFFMLPWVVRRGLFSTFITRGLPVIAQSWNFFAEGGFILPLYFSVYYEGIWRRSQKISPAKHRRRREITRRRNYFVRDGYKRPRFFSIYYEGTCRACMKVLLALWTKCELLA